MLIDIVNSINIDIIINKVITFSSSDQLLYLLVQNLVSITNDRMLFFKMINFYAFIKRRLYKVINDLNNSF